MWSVGCIFGELLTQKPMFAGKSETEQLNQIFKELGTPNEKIWPDWPNLPMVKKIVFTEYPYNNLRYTESFRFPPNLVLLFETPRACTHKILTRRLVNVRLHMKFRSELIYVFYLIVNQMKR